MTPRGRPPAEPRKKVRILMLAQNFYYCRIRRVAMRHFCKSHLLITVRPPILQDSIYRTARFSLTDVVQALTQCLPRSIRIRCRRSVAAI